jgi:hypothetical protein
MIVIAVHDRVDFITNLLNQLIDIDTNGHKILVIDTNSTDAGFLNEFPKLKEMFPNVIFDRKEYDCWDSGAYIHAYKNYFDERYIFLQDSIEITNSNLIKDWDVLLNENDVVPMYNFTFLYDTRMQKEWAIEYITDTSEPIDGIFGPIFGINRKALDLIPNHWLKEPTTKHYACAMERRWSLMFHALNLKKVYMRYLTPIEQTEFFYKSTSNFAQYIRKIFIHRDL